MVKLTIDNRTVEVPEGTTILEAAKTAGIPVPTLCYLKDINEIGACRVCVVEIEGITRLVTACNNCVGEGMVIHTNSPKVRETRKTNVELILSQHDCSCPSCARSGNCNLQKIANDLGILEIPYDKKVSFTKWEKQFPLIRNYEKCIKCMRCIQVCDTVQSLNIWDIANTGSRTTVDVSKNRKITEADCALCGQCITHCPVGALRERDDTEKVFSALADPDKITVVQIAPAVRAAWGEPFGLEREFATVKRLVSAMRRMGFNYIFDTNFSADLTIMEEGSEFLKRLGNKDKETFPMFTSCCPGWVRFLKSQYPDMVPQLSTAKSPQQMFGAMAKSYYADLLGVDPENIFSVSVMPCLAKKHECDLPNMNDAGAGQDVDVVLTTREIDRMIRAEHIVPQELEEEEFDTPLGVGSGAGVIFGATGGVMEAALRSAYYLVTKTNPDPDAFKDVRGMDGWKEASFDLAGTPLKVAVVSGLGNTRRLIKALRKGKVSYDFVEVMACPGGCSGGGGQPINDGQELAGDRADVLYGLDKINEIRFSHENPSVQKCYECYLQRPLSHRSHELLHTDHNAWQMPGEEQ
ncbi:NADH-dependent [FeFe] hydrogenase, group A6 [Murimonas intestini]|uniref:Iron-only hydrogenase group A n=1 Tax=Murimonas intestini TaxID=1337051 RepID=A0AB73T466_9FIRM|nr:NADH-dependent [FeFe] hydrogenase, group A6 [Murimonas intestini]MCR1840523.1 NADH-dependent [FeFe] hydrogenase, group A6 [Murimonas intestini]MCR1865423.1 NADH-dependent [FeFe] hydrogenase, group A6 [Murimonas intestini]MCR1882866.1 NADH-dependent [FeFe] hydrogenase, group A6 [Murimonas intestini]